MPVKLDLSTEYSKWESAPLESDFEYEYGSILRLFKIKPEFITKSIVEYTGKILNIKTKSIKMDPIVVVGTRDGDHYDLGVIIMFFTTVNDAVNIVCDFFAEFDINGKLMSIEHNDVMELDEYRPILNSIALQVPKVPKVSATPKIDNKKILDKTIDKLDNTSFVGDFDEYESELVREKIIESIEQLYPTVNIDSAEILISDIYDTIFEAYN